MIFYMVSSMNCISYTLVCTLDVCIIFGCWLYTQIQCDVMYGIRYNINIYHSPHPFICIYMKCVEQEFSHSFYVPVRVPVFICTWREDHFVCIFFFFFVTRISHTPRFIPKPHWDWYYFRCCAFVYTYENNILFFVASI